MLVAYFSIKGLGTPFAHLSQNDADFFVALDKAMEGGI